MRATKTFDCVEMKDEIQAKLRREREGMTDEEIRDHIRRKLESSSSPVARLWRKVVERDAALARK